MAHRLYPRGFGRCTPLHCLLQRVVQDRVRLDNELLVSCAWVVRYELALALMQSLLQGVLNCSAGKERKARSLIPPLSLRSSLSRVTKTSRLTVREVSVDQRNEYGTTAEIRVGDLKSRKHAALLLKVSRKHRQKQSNVGSGSRVLNRGGKVCCKFFALRPTECGQVQSEGGAVPRRDARPTLVNPAPCHSRIAQVGLTPAGLMRVELTVLQIPTLLLLDATEH